MEGEFVNDINFWPKLSAAELTTTVGDRSDDWEMLENANELASRPLISIESASSSSRDVVDFVVIDDDGETNQNHREESTKPNRRVLRHSISSPILAGTSYKEISGAPSDDGCIPSLSDRDELDDGFSLVSDVASVWTTTSTARSSRTVSFRDAILLSPNKSSGLNGQSSSRLQDVSTAKSPLQSFQQRSRIQPRFVVVPSPPSHIRRCSKSTGDLLKLNVASLTEEMDTESSGVASVSHDRSFDDEFYDRKALGSASRINGLKLRPDEAKRRHMILCKKDQQRLAGSGGTKMKHAVQNK